MKININVPSNAMPTSGSNISLVRNIVTRLIVGSAVMFGVKYFAKSVADQVAERSVDIITDDEPK